MLSRRLLRIKAIQTLYASLKRDEPSKQALQTAEKEFTKSADHCYQLYLVFLDLLTAVCDYASERIEIGRNKFHPTEKELNPNMRWVENPITGMISDAIAPFRDKLFINWNNHKEIVSDLYNEMIAEDYYDAYMQLERCTLSSHKRVLISFLENNLVDNQNIENLIEEKSIYWADDIDYAASFVAETIKEADRENGVTVFEKYKDSDVESFGRELIHNSLMQLDENMKYIVDNCLNWEPERIAFMDKVILLTAIAEVRNFPSIPVKVSLDEYIEISKFYSSEDSSVFINGMMDRIIHKMEQDKVFYKSGRGLLQN